MALRMLNMWFTLLVIWLILNASVATEVVVAGAVTALVISLLFIRFSTVFSDLCFSPQIFYYYFCYLGIFAQELVRANFAVMRLVFSRKITINPGIVEVKTSLKTRIGRLTLANSITLTPGTLVVDVRGDSLFVHWINVTDADPQAATEAIAARFEHYLKVIYG